MIFPNVPDMKINQNKYKEHEMKEKPYDFVIALAGNPNVGKSTIFNCLTGLNQHTGNWPGKTVASASGRYRYGGKNYMLVDIPGTYSLMSNSAEEEIARDFICFGEPDVTVVVADATCLERNLNLVFQVMEITDKVILCVNFLDEAKKKKICIDLKLLSDKLGIPVVGTSARNRKGIPLLMEEIKKSASEARCSQPRRIIYSDETEEAVEILAPDIRAFLGNEINVRWMALRLLDGDESLIDSLCKNTGLDIKKDEKIKTALLKAKDIFIRHGISEEEFRDAIVFCIIKTCEKIADETLSFGNCSYNLSDRKIDRILTSKITGIPIMAIMLLFIFWLTISGANYPSQLISDALFSLAAPLDIFLKSLRLPEFLCGIIIDGAYKTLAWVVSVMLPPMAIFFPLFTLLEDLGYLPRIAFNLDSMFRKACAHGKQALTMCMGFGCNAAGVIGCRIIDSPREKLIAIITNSFVPCNGRFPTLIAIIAMFFVSASFGVFSSFISALILMLAIFLGVAMTFLISKILSKTILKGIPSSFNLELPPYRRPQILKVIVRSVFDRTLYVLGRAVTTSLPAGIVIWTLANIKPGEISLLASCAGFLDPFARLMGLDGYILMAFILGFPANEIVMPVLIMSYMATGSLVEAESIPMLREILVEHGWTWLNAVCFMIFSIMHWPCGTTCLTIRKETNSIKWTFISVLIPTVCGAALCMAVAAISRFFGIV